MKNKPETFYTQAWNIFRFIMKVCKTWFKAEEKFFTIKISSFRTVKPLSRKESNLKNTSIDWLAEKRSKFRNCRKSIKWKNSHKDKKLIFDIFTSLKFNHHRLNLISWAQLIKVQMICKNTLVKTLLKLKPVYAFSNRNRKGIEENIKQK